MKKKVVGFSTYNVDLFLKNFVLTGIYVLPEFRGNNFFKDEITSILETGLVFSIKEPTHLLIDLLIKYGYAKKLNNYLVASAISLDIPISSMKFSEKNFKLNPDDEHASNLYDTSISATISLIDISSSPKANIIGYSRLLDSDIEYADAKKIEKI